jgi:hypothetical protein
MGKLKRSIAGWRERKMSRGEAVLHFVVLAKKERTIEILQGDFVKFRGPLDCTEARGSYRASVEIFEAKEEHDR